MDRYSAIVLAAGAGRRMEQNIPKQYLLLKGKPLVYYALKAFTDSSVDEIILVVAPGEIDYCAREIVEKYHIKKVSHIVEGGSERYHSVYQGLKVVGGDYVLIHDGARAFVTQDIIKRGMDGAKQYKACVTGMPVKDTIKLVDDAGNAMETPPRDRLWMIQTPQCFSYQLVKQAYEALMQLDNITVTDDAMVVETMTSQKVKLIQGSYENIKVTTPEDLLIGESILEQRKNEKPY